MFTFPRCQAIPPPRWTLLLIVLSALLLRLFALNQRGFWFDEAFAYQIAKLPISNIILVSLSDNHPPLYYILLHFITFISHAKYILRLPSLIFSITSIPLLFVLVKRHINKSVALLSILLFAISPLSIYLATESRSHGMATFFGLLVSLVFLRYMQRPTIPLLSLFILLSVISLHIHYYIALLLIACTTIIVFAKTKVSMKTWIVALLIIFISFLPYVILSMTKQGNMCYCPKTLLALPASLIAPIINGVGIVSMRSFTDLPLPLLTLLSITSILSLLFFMRGILKKHVFSHLFLVPLITLSFFGLFFPVFSPKAFSIFLPYYCVIIAQGMYQLRNKFLVWIFFMLLAAVSIAQIVDPFFSGERIEDVYHIVKQKSDVPIAHTSFFTYYPLVYYSQNAQINILLTQNPLSQDTTRFISGQRQGIAKHWEQFFLINIQKGAGTDYGIVLNDIYKQYTVVKSESVGKIVVELLKRK